MVAELFFTQLFFFLSFMSKRPEDDGGLRSPSTTPPVLRPSLFDELYDSSTEGIKQRGKSLAKSALERSFKTAISTLEGMIDNANQKILNERAKIAKDYTLYDMNEIVAQQQIIINAEGTIKALDNEHTALFFNR